MKILGIDTSSKVLSIAIHEFIGIKTRITANISGNSCIREESYPVQRRHSSLLIPNIKEMLCKSGLSLGDIDVFVVGLGPGSFTGLRIGVSTVKGFGIATKKPCIGIPSIDALASLNIDEENKTTVPIIDAKRGQVYSAIYRKEKGSFVRKSKLLLLSVDRLMRKVKGPAIFLGDGIPLYRERIERFNIEAAFLGEEYWYPKASSLIKLALGKKIICRGGHTGRPLQPIYLYPKDCQVK